jgi:hypothetical protein
MISVFFFFEFFFGCTGESFKRTTRHKTEFYLQQKNTNSNPVPRPMSTTTNLEAKCGQNAVAHGGSYSAPCIAPPVLSVS